MRNCLFSLKMFQVFFLLSLYIILYMRSVRLNKAVFTFRKYGWNFSEVEFIFPTRCLIGFCILIYCVNMDCYISLKVFFFLGYIDSANIIIKQTHIFVLSPFWIFNATITSRRNLTYQPNIRLFQQIIFSNYSAERIIYRIASDVYPSIFCFYYFYVNLIIYLLYYMIFI